ncbi:MAG: hypothetical protein DA443_01035 [Bacteroidetes bacterium]|nr:MAG: hypothetical protein DA443_01035 [Bacteroidota bacterium]
MFFHVMIRQTMIKKFSVLLLLTFFFGLMISPDVSAQDREYQLATRLMQQKKYEQACPLFETLQKTYPTRFLFFEKRVECLLTMNDTEEAIQVAEARFRSEMKGSADDGTDGRMDGNLVPRIETRLLLAETLHAGERTEEAFSIWSSIMDGAETYKSEADVSLLIRSLENRREFSLAAQVIEKQRIIIGKPDWYRQALSEIYMQGGEFEKGVQELYEMVVEEPQTMIQVQQRLLRMRETSLYEIAAVELEDRLFTLDEEHIAYGQLFQLLSWLYLETENYDRALRFARRYESRSERARQQVYVLGIKFRSAHQYELAVEAFSFYEKDETNLRWRALEEMANTYGEWAGYIVEKSLVQGPASDDLYQRAYQTYEVLYSMAPTYSNTQKVLTSLLDLSLDIYHDPELAEQWLDALRGFKEDGIETAYTHYAKGRLYLFGEEYRMARQRLTRADRLTQDANLSEKVRFYLSLADLFAGDNDFAVIQLASLQRRSSSWYANEAIVLEQWIQSGLRADSTGSQLLDFTRLYRQLLQGDYKEALKDANWITDYPDHAFAGHASIQLARYLPSSYAQEVLLLIRQIEPQFESKPIHERLLWEQAKAARILLQTGQKDSGSAKENTTEGIQMEELDQMVQNLYEELLYRYPGGYYTELARTYLQRQQQPASS